MSTAHKSLNAEIAKKNLSFKLSDAVFIMLINVKMPTILTFMSMINFMFDFVEHEKSFITSGRELKKYQNRY